MDYGAKAGGYVDAFMEAIDGENVVRRYGSLGRTGRSQRVWRLMLS
jgi:hypothetical protein